ncbi:hypothetical protein FOA52_007273 [Chlamydomonas sp. UWO 241]|nr:hypothetical protein FOA52_007273 [Chlamydomonas sp. UWO 241]
MPALDAAIVSLVATPSNELGGELSTAFVERYGVTAIGVDDASQPQPPQPSGGGGDGGEGLSSTGAILLAALLPTATVLAAASIMFYFRAKRARDAAAADLMCPGDLPEGGGLDPGCSAVVLQVGDPGKGGSGPPSPLHLWLQTHGGYAPSIPEEEETPSKSAPCVAPAAKAAQPARPAAAAAPVASAAGAPAAERPAAAGAARAASARGPSRLGGLPARVGETSLCRSHVLSIPVAAATRLIASRGSEGQMARDGIVRGALRDASYLGSTRHVRRLFSDCYGSEETAVAAAAVRVAAAAVDGVSLPVCLAMNLVRFVHDVSGRDRPAGGGVVSASFLNAKPAVGGIGVEPRRGGATCALYRGV